MIIYSTITHIYGDELAFSIICKKTCQILGVTYIQWIIGKREQRGTWRTQLKGVLKYIQMSGPVEHTCLVYNHMCSLCIRMFKRQCLSSFLVISNCPTTSAKSHTHHLRLFVNHLRSSSALTNMPKQRHYSTVMSFIPKVDQICVGLSYRQNHFLKWTHYGWLKFILVSYVICILNL